MPISTAILLAGGSGNRMQGQVEDKILAPLAGKPVIAHSIEAFLASGQVQHLVIVVRDAAQQAAIEAILASSLIPHPSSVSFTTGGAQRQDSVFAGLQAAPADTEIALIHDCARPCVTPEAIRESIAQAADIGAACLARPVTDTIKSADTYDGAYLPTTVDRSKLWAMETPQSFQYPIIRDAYQSIIASGAQITDDLSAIEDIDQPVAFVDNRRPNPKLTTPADLPYLEYLLTQSLS
ncbi:2-C-methyl-D-erythritol 4-phosphate cytidylyltransferase [Pelagicoccus sp. SDUM812005]|uniref:2-C-methyl-D-erythritol 4-phosphate cytidylyltransferase n=1 Tax=Pelagicoccus sp. SDUM812005 TaxID=3041257 RepID=UPI00280F0F55|nr:2-C-methyl-D-erythritol 4-phosphate cytidylyltransferase [Pelagicoccus sp. SDUM812005]MDQ8183209.1 2-C-methyl-D-erythritol 4-phosphate cytidylyltransferase [Pelagicoccus sp. SDUM812005]